MAEDFETLKERCNVGFNKDVGIKLMAAENGHCEAYIDITEKHINPLNSVHGGIIFTLADTVGGFALRSKGMFPTTISSTINYTKAIFGGRMYGVADVITNGKTIGVSVVKILNDKGEECARAQITYYHLKLDK